MAAGKVIGFGTSDALKAETPKQIKWIYRAVMLLSSMFTVITMVYPEMPASIQLQTLKGITVGNALLYLVCQQFGWVEAKNN